MRGFQFRLSLQKLPARVFGLRLAFGQRRVGQADEAPRRTREKNLWYPG